MKYSKYKVFSLVVFHICSTHSVKELNDYHCSPQFEIVTDFSAKDCKDGYYYKENVIGCFPGCVEKKFACDELNACPPGYICSKSTCVINEESCLKYYIDDPDNKWYNAAWKPRCSSDGTWAAVQCKDVNANGRCFCYTTEGTRIFGQAWANRAADMTCACSRRYHEVSKNRYVTFHCDSMGNYEQLQCDSGHCWCADNATGDIVAAIVPEKMMTYLPCYSASKVGSQYLRKCESQAYAQAKILKELNIHGTKYANQEFIMCDSDGSYGAYMIKGGIVYCIWRDSSKIGSFMVSVDEGLPGTNCRCARDKMLFEKSGLVFTQLCSGNGNYKRVQQTGGKFYCVDDDGFALTELFDKLPDCSQFL